MYAVIETGGKQYRVSPGQTLEVELLEQEPGATVTLDRVLLVSSDGNTTVGQPTVAVKFGPSEVKTGSSLVGEQAPSGRGGFSDLDKDEAREPAATTRSNVARRSVLSENLKASSAV